MDISDLEEKLDILISNQTTLQNKLSQELDVLNNKHQTVLDNFKTTLWEEYRDVINQSYDIGQRELDYERERMKNRVLRKQIKELKDK